MGHNTKISMRSTLANHLLIVFTCSVWRIQFRYLGIFKIAIISHCVWIWWISLLHLLQISRSVLEEHSKRQTDRSSVSTRARWPCEYVRQFLSNYLTFPSPKSIKLTRLSANLFIYLICATATAQKQNRNCLNLLFLLLFLFHKILQAGFFWMPWCSKY